MRTTEMTGHDDAVRGAIRLPLMLALGLTTAVLCVVLVSASNGQEGQPGKNGAGFPDLGAGLMATKGCLGVESATTSSGKNVIFAWFKDRKACLRWYYSDMHQAMMHEKFGKEGEPKRKPLAHVPEDYEGPIMAIASITFTEGEQQVEGVNLPISQIAIELYAPLGGGLALGGRFAPAAMEAPVGMVDYGSVGDNHGK